MLILHKANKERFENVRRDCLRAISQSGSVSLWIVYDFDRPGLSNLGTYEDVERLTFDSISNLFCSPLEDDSFYWFWSRRTPRKSPENLRLIFYGVVLIGSMIAL